MVKSVLDLSSPHAVANGSTAMEKFALEAMFLAGQHDAALVRMQTRFKEMIDCDLSTLWEHWESDPSTGQPISGYNHGWSGGALVLLSQYVAGLAPTSPGWATFDVKPELGMTLRNVSASVLTTYGTISVAILRSGDDQNTTLRLRLQVPETTVAKLHLPLLQIADLDPRQRLGVTDVMVSPPLPPRSDNRFDDARLRQDVISIPAGSWTVKGRYY